jgi:hypothetical protein
MCCSDPPFEFELGTCSKSEADGAWHPSLCEPDVAISVQKAHVRNIELWDLLLRDPSRMNSFVKAMHRG